MDLALLWAVRTAVALLLITPLVVTNGTVFPFIVGKAVYSRVVIEIAFALWLVLAIRRPEYRPARSWLTTILAAFVLFALVSALFGVSFTRSFWGNFERMQGVFDLGHWLLLLIVLLSVVRGGAQWRAAFNGFVAIGLVAALLGATQRLGWQLLPFLEEKTRIDITFGNPIYAGAYMMLTALVAAGLLVDSFRPSADSAAAPQRSLGRTVRSRAATSDIDGYFRLGMRLFWGFTALLAIWILAETVSRGPTAGLIAGVLTVGALYAAVGTQRQLRAAAAAGIVALLLGGAILFAARDAAAVGWLRDQSLLIDRAVRIVDDRSFGERQLAARIGIQAVAERPLTGWGVQNFAVPFHRHIRPGDVYGSQTLDQTHNQFIEILATAGVLGFAAYAALWGWTLWLAVAHVRRSRSDRLLSMFLTGALVACLVNLLFLFDTTSTFIGFMLLMAWAGGTERTVIERARLAIPGDAAAPPQSTVTHTAAMSGRQRRRHGEDTVQDWRWALRQHGAPAAIGIALIVGFAWIHQPMYQAAKFLVRGAVTPDVAVAGLSVFEPMAAYGQVRLVQAVTASWDEFSEEEQALLIPLLAAELDKAGRAEPASIDVSASAAGFYRTAAEADSSLLALARVHADEVKRLGPHTRTAYEAQIRQAVAERDLDAAEAAVHTWKTQHAHTSPSDRDRYDGLLETLRRQVADEGKQGSAVPAAK